MIKRVIVLFLACLSIFSFTAQAASAAGDQYYRWRTYNKGAIVDDKALALYVNTKEVRENRDGWCFTPGNSSNRGSNWSCTVKSTVREVYAPEPDSVHRHADGKDYVAHPLPKFAGQRPYCLPGDTTPEGNGVSPGNFYYCAYWVRSK